MPTFIAKITMWILVIGLPLFVIPSCYKIELTANASGTYLVRVVNARTDTISVVIGPADYGAIAPNDTTDYKEVYEGENTVWLNGQVFQGSPARFGKQPNHCRWTYVFDFDQSWVYFLEGCR